MTNLVIVISDEDADGSLVLHKARNIARAFEAEAEVVQFIPQSSSETARQTASQSISELVHTIFSDCGDVSSQVVPTDRIPEWVGDHCSSGNDNMVVVTGHRNENLFHTPVDWSLIRRLHCPVLIGCDKKWRSKRNVLIALDLSTGSASHRDLNVLALRWAKQWKAVNDCQLHAMYCIPIPAPLLALDIVERREYQRAHEPEAKRKLKALLDEIGMSEVTPHVIAGTPEKRIPHIANQLKADLVIIGSFGHGGMRRLLHDNTAEKVLHHLRTDLLVVKPTARPVI